MIVYLSCLCHGSGVSTKEHFLSFYNHVTSVLNYDHNYIFALVAEVTDEQVRLFSSSASESLGLRFSTTVY